MNNQIIQYLISICYSSKNRYYHTYEHVQDMLDTLENLIKQDSTLLDKIENYEAFKDAIIFHDIVQGTDSSEQLSAELASLLLSKKYSEQERKYIKNLIKATDYTKSNIDYSFDMQLIRDLDLKNLASNWIDYLLNSFKLRKESNFCTDIQWKDARSKFLNLILSMSKIYETKYFNHLENIARDNIQKELSKL